MLTFTFGDALDKLVVNHSDTFKDKIFDSSCKLKHLLNFSFNVKNAHLLKQLEAPLKDEGRSFHLSFGKWW